jgi:hypothetical protein
MPTQTIYPRLEDQPASTAQNGDQWKKRPAARSRQSIPGRAKGGQDRAARNGDKVFEVRCESRDQRRALISTTELSAVVAQRIRRNNSEQMWDSVIIHCTEEEDGTMAVRILITNPDWHESIQIAHIRSRPYDENSLTALGCNLDHVSEKRPE